MNSKPLRKNIMVFSLVVLLVLVTRYFVAAEEIPPTIKDKILESVGTHSAEVFVYKQKLAPLTVIKPLFNTEENSNSLTIEVTGFSWLFIADAYPCTSFAHPIEVGIIDEKTQDIQKKNYLWWPIIHEPNAQWHALRYFLKHEQEQYNNLLQSNIPMCNPQDNVICCDSPLAPSSWVSQSMPGSKPNFWAVVIAGGLATGDELSYAKDADSMVSLLIAHGVRTDHIFYFLPDEVKTFLQAPPAQYRSHFIFKNLALASPEPLTLDNISKTFSRVAEAMQNQDVQKLTFLFMISSHGANKVVSLHPSPNQNELISTDQLATWINALPCQNITVLMDACQSGTFIDVTYNNTKKCYQTAQNFGLLDPKAMKKGSQRLVIVSACNIELSRPDIDYALPNAPGENNEDRGSEFLGGFIEAFANPLADKNPQDGMISLGEAFDFAYKYACYAGITHPNPTFKDANHPYFRLVLRGSSQTYVYDPEKKAKILYQEYLFK